MTEQVSHYRIIEKIGSGGMGDVFLAEDTNLHRRVALKMLRRAADDTPQNVRRFMREAYAASALSHPNIAVIYEAGGTPSEDHFIAMEYVAGETLNRKLSHGPLSTDEIIELAIEIADALDEAHAKGIIHRDLKPSNVMLSARGHAKVLDFGLAKMVRPSGSDGSTGSTDVRSISGLVCGTVPYMSPEQVLGRAVDERSDIFSFGVLLYEMATGRRPFSGRSSTELAEQICHAEPDAIARLNHRIPEELDRIIRKCIEKDAASRYQSAREVAVDLKNLRRDSAPHHVTPGHRPRWHRPALMAILAALLATAAVTAGWYLLQRAAAADPVDSLAVLPFANADPRSEYLSDGITISVIDSLSELPQVKVMSRSTVFRFKGRSADPQEVGRRLKVRAVVSGRLSQVGDRLTVAAEMVDVRDGHQIWGEQYDRQAADVFAIQTEIAKAISDELRVKLTGAQRERLAKHYNTDPETYALYLKGRYHSNRRTTAELQRGIEYFQAAISRDPAYAPAYVGLADAYGAYPDASDASNAEWFPRAKAAVQRALDIDPSAAEAHAVLGLLKERDWDLDGAAREYRRALDLNPNYASAHHWYSLALCRLGRPDEAFAEITTAQQLDPLSPLINMAVGFEQWARGNPEEAVRELRSTIEVDPNFGWAYTYLGSIYATQGHCADAMDPLRKGARLTQNSSDALAHLGYGLGRCGDRAGALRIDHDLTARSAPAITRALVACGIGDTDAALRHVQKAVADGDPQWFNISWEPEYATVRADPRYAALVSRIRSGRTH